MSKSRWAWASGAIISLVVAGAFVGRAEDPARSPRQRGRKVDLPDGIDLDGKLHRLRAQDGVRAIAIVFLSVDCPISNGYLPELNRLAKRYRDRVDAYGVISSPSVSREEAIEHREEYGVKFPVLFDASGGLRKKLKPTRTPQAVLLDAEGRILYSGAIDDRHAAVGRSRRRARKHHLERAIRETLAGRRVSTPRTKPVGCLMERSPAAGASTDVTFARDIAPLVRAHCAACHRPGQRAPFSLLDYEDVSRHARQIVEVIDSGLMPPWKPEPQEAAFRNARRLTERQKELFRTWERNGKPRGKAQDRLPAPEFESGWQLGEPDLVLKMEEAFEVPADGPDQWQHFVFESVVSQDRLVAAVEFQPGAAAAIHHASFYLDTSGDARRLDERHPGYGYPSAGGGPLFAPTGILRAWFPGAHPHPLPKGTGRPLAKGSDFVLEIHYHPTGRALEDQSVVGIHFAEPSARHLVNELQVMNLDLDIPAGEDAHRHRASMTLPEPVYLLDAAPHMHLLGKSVKAVAKLPDGEEIPLVDVPDWDFNWQGHYVYRKPLRLPAGTRIDAEFVYDNSRGNPLNPNRPPVDVAWGDETTDEMGICQFQFVCENLGDYARMARFKNAYAVREYEQYYEKHADRYRKRLRERRAWAESREE